MRKVIDWIKTHKLATLAIVLFLVTIIVVIVFSRKKETPPTPTPTPVKFELLRTYPHGGVQETAFPTTAIQFAFSKPLDRNVTRAEIFPSEDFELVFQNSDSMVYVKPKPFWTIGKEYKIKLYVKSTDGETLSPIDFTFQFVSPQNSDLEEIPLQP